MALQNSFKDRTLDRLRQQTKNAIADLIDGIKITPDLCLQYQDYSSEELPAETRNSLEKLPPELQERYLTLRLANFIYQIFSNFAENAIQDGNSPPEAILKNNTWWGLNIDFTQQLHQSNSGTGYFDPGWQVIKHKDDSRLVVHKDNLKLTIESDRHLSSEASFKLGDLVSVRMPRNLVEEGYYLAVGNAGLTKPDGSPTIVEPIEIYFNVNALGTVALMKALTLELNQVELPFTFKVLYDPDFYYRYDSSVLRIDKSNYFQVKQIVQTIHQQEGDYFQPQVLPFTKLLAPGLSIAEEPEHKFIAEESFGMNRCRILADSLIAAWQSDDSPEQRKQLLEHNFAARGLDWQRPYLNADSTDIYSW